MRVVKVDDPVTITPGADAVPEPDYVDQIDNKQASVVSPGGSTRTVAVADLPRGAKEGDYLSGGQVVAAPTDDAAPIRARLSAGDDGGTISLDDAQPAAAATPAGPAGSFPGLAEAGNIDLASRPQVKNPDGSTSTVRSASFNIDGKEVLLPTVSDGPNARLLSDDEAVAQYMKTGKHLGKFDTPENADRYAQALHEQQAKFYGLNGQPSTPAGAPGRLPQDQLDAIAAQGAYAPPPGAAPAAAGEPPIGTTNVLGAVVPVQGQPSAGAPPAGTPATATGPATLPPGSADLEQRIKDTTEASSKAATNLGEKEEQAATDIGQAYADRAELQRQQAADMAAQQQYVHDRQAALDKEDADVLKEAQQKTIPDFWAGNEGGKVGAAITVALSGFFGGALAGATGTTFHNQALEAIQHNVDAYYGREKEKIDNLYKYAEQKGMLDEKTKARYASELTDLMQQHAYTLASAADRIQQVQAESQGQVDKAKADQMAAALQGQATSELQQARGLDIKRFDSESDRMKAEADQLRARADMVKANAVKAKHAGGGGGGAAGGWLEAMQKAAQEPGATQASVMAAATANGYRGKMNQLGTMASKEVANVGKQTEGVEKQMKDFETQLNGPGGKGGPGSQLSRIQAMKMQLSQAAAAGDPDGIKAAVTAIKEEAGGMLSGGKTTKYTGHMLAEAQSLEDQLKSNWSKISGHPTEGAHYVSAMQKLLNTVEGEKLQEVHEIRQKAVDQTLGPGGTANSEAAKRHALARFKGITGAIKDANGNPVYMEGGATGQAPASAAPASPQWKPIPSKMAGNPQLRGKTQVLVDAAGNITDAK